MNFGLAKIGVMPVGAIRNGPTYVGPNEHFVLVKPLRLYSRLAEEE